MSKRIGLLLLILCAAALTAQKSYPPGSGGGGSVTSVATTSPIGGGTITTTGTITCTSCATVTRSTASSSSTPTPAATTNGVTLFDLTAQAATATFGAPTGSPSDGDQIRIRIKDNGSAQTLDFSNSAYRASSDLAFPTTTVMSKTLYILVEWNSTDSKWDLLSVLNNF